ncbi:hypothetical protein BD410DRAFT_781692 [Rickenella mellea]|uniref:F-box domain-containing protein n=1 Tax=Rickenella mellea TaxID=50990 RepID=A0A4Y7QJF5_9AGAM|nr:hypothetical protein BD410DRAFT_781692 [Rickenella mellea]
MDKSKDSRLRRILDEFATAHISSSADEVITAIDEEMQFYSEVICALRSRRNNWTTLCRIPDEALSHIFLMLSHSTYPFRPFSFDKSWMVITKVCRRWRYLALDCPSLWSRVVVQPCSFAQTSTEIDRITIHLMRSKYAPLDVEVDIRNDQRLFLARLALEQNFHRIASLDIYFPEIAQSANDNSWDDFTSILTTARAPKLERVVLRNPNQLTREDDVMPRMGKFFQDHAIKELCLMGFYIPTRSWPWKRLVRLHLQSNISHETTPYGNNLSQLVQTMQYAVCLEDIRLDLLGHTLDSDSGPEPLSAELPSLRRIALRFSKETILRAHTLLRCLNIDLKAQTHLVCDNYPLARPMQMIPPVFSDILNEVSVHVHLAFDRLTIVIFRTSDDESVPQRGSLFTLSVGWNGPTNAFQQRFTDRDILATLIGSSLSSHVVRLAFILDKNVPKSLWAVGDDKSSFQFLSFMPSIRVLYFDRVGSEPILPIDEEDEIEYGSVRSVRSQEKRGMALPEQRLLKALTGDVTLGELLCPELQTLVLQQKFQRRDNFDAALSICQSYRSASGVPLEVVPYPRPEDLRHVGRGQDEMKKLNHFIL